ncbi:M57 family metalloprotease [Myxococcus sp. Y35]|uniref:M57 family metalloprotease n=1 Tax=Pseudomyxococcus flavus TaxID=3115648 RepID=UPI003CE761E7
MQVEQRQTVQLLQSLLKIPDICITCPHCCPPPDFRSIDFVTNPVLPSGGATSGGPSGGNPFQQIQINAGPASHPDDTIEHVITHELGQVIGLRHSDDCNRAISCGGSSGNEGPAGMDANHIPGMPTTATTGGSLMNSCFSAGTTGEFTSSDITALTTRGGLRE